MGAAFWHFDNSDPDPMPLLSSPSSRYFLTSPSSPYGAVSSFGPFLDSWEQQSYRLHAVDGLCDTRCAESDVTEARGRSPAIEPFRCCSGFISKYQVQQQELVSPLLVERSIHKSVRHLCAHQCYMKAYAPVREWYKLRSALHRNIVSNSATKAFKTSSTTRKKGQSIDNLLQGWKCQLLVVGSHRSQHKEEQPNGRVGKTTTSEGEDKRPLSISSYKVVFVAPNGEVYTSVKKALNRLETLSSIIARTLSSTSSNVVSPTALINSSRLRVIGEELDTICARNFTINQSMQDNYQKKGVKRRLDFFDNLIGSTSTLSTTKRTGTFVDNIMQPSLTSVVDVPIASPYGLLEELFGNSPWKLLLSAMLLNRTTRSQGVDAVLNTFLQRWPNPSYAASCDDMKEIARIIRPLGMKNKRARFIVEFSKEYLKVLSLKRYQLARNSVSIGEEGCPYIHTTCFVHKCAFTEVLCNLKQQHAPMKREDQASCGTQIKDSGSKYFVSSKECGNAEPCQCHCCIADCHMTHPEFFLTDEEILKFPCCGQYALDVYSIFIRKELRVPQSNDRALLSYVEYQRCRLSSHNVKSERKCMF